MTKSKIFPERRVKGGAAAVLVAVMLVVGGCGGVTRPVSIPSADPERSGRASAICEVGREFLERREYVAAAERLDRCIEIDPTQAYAYYYAGLAYSELDRVDLMIIRFERFVQLAPDAPERPRVESILATARR